MTTDPPAAVITGGQGDLGQAIAAELRGRGWTVHDPGRAELDVTRPDLVREWFGRLAEIDLLVHQAGILRDGPVARMSEADFDDVMDVHLTGAFHCAQAALRKMVRQRRGHIVFVGSLSALSGPAGQANYAAAKAALLGLMQSLAAEHGPRNIRVNAILPGFLATRMTAALLADEARRREVLRRHVLGRLNSPPDVARFIAFLHSMENVSGQVFQLDSRLRPWT